MKDIEARKIKKKIRVLLIVFVLGLVFGCQIVLFVAPELAWLNNTLGPGTRMGQYFPNLSAWINHLYEGITETYSKYPFIAYCMDWLAFAQLAFIIFFIGALIDPVRNIWIIKSGMVICVLHILLAFGSGNFRGVPLFWQLLDSSFGFIGLIVLYIAYKNVKILEKIQKTD
jgi:hypothetical protein